MLTLRLSLGPRDKKKGSAAQAPISTTRDAARAALLLGALGGMPASCSPLVSSDHKLVLSAIFMRKGWSCMQFDSSVSEPGACPYCIMAGARNGFTP